MIGLLFLDKFMLNVVMVSQGGISKGVQLKKREEEVQVGVNANAELEREEECAVKHLLEP